MRFTLPGLAAQFRKSRDMRRTLSDHVRHAQVVGVE
jgi:hypothetical protein